MDIPEEQFAVQQMNSVIAEQELFDSIPEIKKPKHLRHKKVKSTGLMVIHNNDKLVHLSYGQIRHGVSLVRPNPKFMLKDVQKILSLGGESKIGITRKVRGDSSTVRKAKTRMAHYNSRKIRHHWTKKEHAARR